MKIELLYAGSCPGWQLTGAGLRLALPAVPDAMTPVTCRTEGGAGEAGRRGFGRPLAILASGRDPAGRPGDLVGLAGHRYPRDGVDHPVIARQTRAALAHAA